MGCAALPEDDFTKGYRARLDTIGLEALTACFAEISQTHDDQGLVLLCFEPAGAFCHRRVFAEWFEEQTGEVVPELQPAQLELGGE